MVKQTVKSMWTVKNTENAAEVYSQERTDQVHVYGYFLKALVVLNHWQHHRTYDQFYDVNTNYHFVL